MKKFIKKNLIIAALFASLVGHTNVLNIYTSTDLSKGTKVTFENVDKGTIILIKDQAGANLFEEKVKKAGTFVKGFDLTNLPDASYYFEIEDGDEIKIIPFTVKDHIAEFVKGTEYSIAKPDVKVDNNYVHISKNSSDKQNLDIKVYYEGTDLAYEESLKDVQNINRTYDFSTSMRGNYIIVMSTEGRTFVNNISIP